LKEFEQNDLADFIKEYVVYRFRISKSIITYRDIVFNDKRHRQANGQNDKIGMKLHYKFYIKIL